MDLLKIESLKDEFQDLREIFDLAPLRGLDPEKAEVNIKVQRVDKKFLEQTLTDQEDSRSNQPRREESYHLYVYTKNSAFSLIPPRIRRWNVVRCVHTLNNRRNIYEDEDLRGEPRIKGEPIFYTLQKMGGLKRILRLILVHIVQEGQGYPRSVKSVDITILKVPRNVTLGDYIDELFQRIRSELLKEIGDIED